MIPRLCVIERQPDPKAQLSAEIKREEISRYDIILFECGWYGVRPSFSLLSDNGMNALSSSSLQKIKLFVLPIPLKHWMHSLLNIAVPMEFTISPAMCSMFSVCSLLAGDAPSKIVI